ncbi:hypothetical protein ACFV5G_41865, partial [Streptomyces sp. NPDC059766]|uniref:hypothetical protein n=1 Tax=Streptomyces sp. NPDC059766 TaxID=3346940 RepID=UPI00365596DD
MVIKPMVIGPGDSPDDPTAREIDRLAASYWDFLLVREPSLRTRRGLPVESRAGGWGGAAAQRARVAPGVGGRRGARRGAGRAPPRPPPPPPPTAGPAGPQQSGTGSAPESARPVS